MKSGIYQIVSPSGRRYVGSSANVRSRWSGHRISLTKGNHHCRALQFAANKYGVDNLEFSLLERCAVEDLTVREQHYIDQRTDNYNSAPVAGSIRGFKLSEETKRRMSESATGKPCSAETRAKMSAYSRNRSPEHLSKLAASLTGKRASQATRAKQRAAKIGKKQTPEHVAAVMAATRNCIRADNKSGVRGAFLVGSRWRARVRIAGKYVHLGYHETLESAAQAIAQAKQGVPPL